MKALITSKDAQSNFTTGARRALLFLYSTSKFEFNQKDWKNHFDIDVPEVKKPEKLEEFI